MAHRHDKAKAAVENAPLNDIEAKKGKGWVEEDLQEGRVLSLRISPFCHQCRIQIEFAKVLLPALVCIVEKTSPYTAYGKC